MESTPNPRGRAAEAIHLKRGRDETLPQVANTALAKESPKAKPLVSPTEQVFVCEEKNVATRM